MKTVIESEMPSNLMQLGSVDNGTIFYGDDGLLYIATWPKDSDDQCYIQLSTGLGKEMPDDQYVYVVEHVRIICDQIPNDGDIPL